MNRIKLLLCGVAFAAALSSTAHAQGVVDMKKFTCEQLLSASANSIEAAIWLSGYYNGLRKNTKFDLGQFRKNAEIVVKQCGDNPKQTVMSIANKLTSRAK